MTPRVVARPPDFPPQPQPLITWGGYDKVDKLQLPSLMELRSSYGWCLNDVEMEELKAYQDELAEATSAYLGDDDIRRLRLAVELAYQSRAWSKTEGRSDARLAHAVAVARCLADLQMEVEAVVAALLAGVCEDTGLALKQVDDVLGPTVASAVRDLTNVWRLSDVMQVCLGGRGMWVVGRARRAARRARTDIKHAGSAQAGRASPPSPIHTPTPLVPHRHTPVRPWL